MHDTLVSATEDGIRFAENNDREPHGAPRLPWHEAAEVLANPR